MQRESSATPVASAPVITTATNASKQARTESQAAEAMWAYFQAHRDQLIADIKAYRTELMAQLMAGEPVDRAFASYARPPSATVGRPKKQAA